MSIPLGKTQLKPEYSDSHTGDAGSHSREPTHSPQSNSASPPLERPLHNDTR